jgi:hypothetical protein
MQAHGRPAERIRRLPAVFREFIREHDQRIAKTDLRMTDAPVRHHQLVALDSSKRALVEVQRLGGVLDREVRRHGAMSVGNGLHCG